MIPPRPDSVCSACGAPLGIPHCLGWCGSYGFGVDYTSSIRIGSWPLVHIASGFDPVTMRPRIAKGVLAIGNVAVGVLAIGGVTVGVFTIGGVSVGLLAAIGGVAMGSGLSIGGVAFGAMAIGGVAAGVISAVTSAPTAWP